MINAYVDIDIVPVRSVEEQLDLLWDSIQELWDALDALSGDEKPEHDEP